ncbi:Tetratricopeptide repeat protein 39B [Hypsizygus marmoreus]|uniref:Tetratricopeptide repeat protein 39B n=1 Tax=Hypsizygus marmoreus TaxID=39966 RepID=A0A369J9P5_HYPMA|nr:Tetratricopeptide repeat protein 39B [Hypsizygus marmoreus]
MAATAAVLSLHRLFSCADIQEIMAEGVLQPSWRTIYSSPPPVKAVYTPREALSDLPGISYALELFLASKMVESEEYCHRSDEKKERLYFATGYGLIQCVKGLMSYADEDLLSAINHTRQGNYVASQHRKKAGFFGSILGTAGLGHSSGVAFIKSMSNVERHAELVYAESLFEKALLGIMYSGDWLAFIKEALNMRTTISIYRQLGAFIDDADAAYAASLRSVPVPPSPASSTTSSFSSVSSYSYTSTASSSSTSMSTTSFASSTSARTEAGRSTPPSSARPIIANGFTPTSPTTPKSSLPTPRSPISLSSKSTTRTKNPRVQDPSIDPHFRSGVYLGVGMCNIVLSLMPGKLATLVELFGYKGDRRVGLELLMRAGGWDGEFDEGEGSGEGDGAREPTIGTAEEGLRRTICDMSLLIFHLVLSSFTVECVDIGIAARVLEWNLKRYPNGVFFLFGAGRLALQRSQPRQAIHYYTLAMESQRQYRNLHHISFWEIAVARLALWEVGEGVIEDSVRGEKEGEEEGKEGDKEEKRMEVGGSAACWRVLEQEATWSKSIYSYGLAVCLLEEWDTENALTDEKERETKREGRAREAAELMAKVPVLRQKIAGKSIPLEKFVARKARKFTTQKNRLALPALEVAYLFQAIAHAPRGVIIGKMLPQVYEVLGRLGRYGDVDVGAGVLGEKGEKGVGGEKGKGKKEGVEAYEGGAHEYWDDLCLAKFLEGVCLRYVAYPDPDAVPDPTDSALSGDISKEDAEKGALRAFKSVFEYGPRIELDHHLVYHAHYELGRLLACQGDEEGAKHEFELVLSGKPLEVGPSGRKGKYSMESALHMRTHAALDALRNKKKP